MEMLSMLGLKWAPFAFQDFEISSLFKPKTAVITKILALKLVGKHGNKILGKQF